MPDDTTSTIGDVTASPLEAIRQSRRRHRTASSGRYVVATEPVSDESTPFRSQSRMAATRLDESVARAQREVHEFLAVNDLLFNHESPRRCLVFFTRKIGAASL